MPSYQFRYLDGQSMPYETIQATDDADFAAKVAEWEKRTGFSHVPSTLTVAEGTHVIRGTFRPEERAVAEAFFAHKRAHPEPVPYEQLTPLQKRMQSGGA